MKKLKMIIRVVSIAMILFITSTIFSFSSQNAEKSSSVSGKVAEKIIEIQPKYKNITEQKKTELVELYQHPVRKMAHFTIYTLLGVAIMAFICTYDLKNKNRIIISIVLGAVYAASDEIHQTFIEGRSGQITDVLLDTFGVCVGIMIVIGIWKMCKKWQKVEKETCI